MTFNRLNSVPNQVTVLSSVPNQVTTLNSVPNQVTVLYSVPNHETKMNPWNVHFEKKMKKTKAKEILNSETN